jgi:hypothetical protein
LHGFVHRVNAKVLGAARRTVELDEPAPLKRPVHNCGGQVGVVQDSPPLPEPLVGGEDHRAFLQMSVVHNVEQNVGGVGAVGQVPYLVDDEDRRMGVVGQSLLETPLAAGVRQVIDERCRRREQGVEPVLDGLVGHSDGQMRLASPCFAVEDQAPTLGREVRAQERSQRGGAQGRLVREVEVIDRLQKRELGLPREALNAGLLAVGHLSADQCDQECVESPALLLGALDQGVVCAPRVREVEAFEVAVQVDGIGVRHGVSLSSKSFNWLSLSRIWAMYSAP